MTKEITCQLMKDTHISANRETVIDAVDQHRFRTYCHQPEQV